MFNCDAIRRRKVTVRWMKEVRRGYSPKDHLEFGKSEQEKMKRAAEEIYYFLNRGYDIKSCTTYVGNHHLLSERQRLALLRSMVPGVLLDERMRKEIPQNTSMDKVYIDGFNTIITLEVAFSKCLLVQGMDTAIRDLAGLRGTYRIVDKTKMAIDGILNALDRLKVREAVFYLDRPVSNSGRLKQYILQLSEEYNTGVQVEVINDVDRTLYDREGVITSDAVILDKSRSWYNLNRFIIQDSLPEAWIYDVFEN